MKLPLLHVDRADCLQLERSMTREWLETDGRGGFASSTILACPARRQHGLLVAPAPGTTRRHVFLSRFEEHVVGGDKSFALSMARYAGTWSPLGHQGLECFELAPHPAWRFAFGALRVQREVQMVRGEHTVLVRYRVSGRAGRVVLRLRPLLPFREADALTFENAVLDQRVERLPAGIRARPYSALPALSIVIGGHAAREVHFEADPVWYRGIEYPTDIQRGYEGHEDQFSPGTLEVELALGDGGEPHAVPGDELCVVATLGALPRDPLAAWERASAARRTAVARVPASGARGLLALTADDFLYRTEHGRTGVIAGYPWFGEWGRDTCISLPGLLLARDRVDECVEALEALVPFLRGGLLPNVFGATPAASHYDSADASLWFVRAVRACELAADATVGERLLPALTRIAEAYRDGTELGIGSDAGGLLVAGHGDLNATWMDARTAQGPVTPRDGCAVELNALWYFLLAYLETIHRRADRNALATQWGELRRKAGAAFRERFWLDARYLADVWKDGVADVRVRPNMVVAAALEWSPLTPTMRADVVAVAQAELLTPRGLRTLEPRDPAYEGRYAGDQERRDRAYHQGTVWPWLLGFFCEAVVRAHGPERTRIAALRELLEGFGATMTEAGTNHVSEVFDGDPPHHPGGTIAQAWNSAELLRAWRLLESPSR